MYADAHLPRPDRNDTWVALGYAVLLHIALLAMLVLAGWWQRAPVAVSAAGPVIEAALVITSADVQHSEQALADAPKPEPVPEPEPPKPAVEEAAPPPQPLPEPRPQVSPEPPQVVPQEQLPEPDTRDQERIVRLAEEQAEREKQEQEARRRQEQIDLTERKKQEEAEKRQRLLKQQKEQLEAIRREREAAAKATKLAEAKLQQLADRQPTPAKATSSPSPAPAAPLSGNNGVDTDLRARYAAAMKQVAHANWNRTLAPEGVPCRVNFVQIPGGEVIDVQFINCPYDAAGRDSVVRALQKSPMPYAGFEPVFERKPTITFCYPQEACPR